MSRAHQSTDFLLCVFFGFSTNYLHNMMKKNSVYIIEILSRIHRVKIKPGACIVDCRDMQEFGSIPNI